MITVSFIFWLVQLTSPSVISLPETPAIIPVEGTLFKSADNGMTWANLDSGLPTALNPFSFYPGDDTYYLAAADGLYKGNGLLPVPGWKKEPFELKRITAFFPGRDGLYVISEREGLLQYQSLTGLWNPISKNLQDKTIYTMVETPDGAIVAGCETGMYKTKDHGNTWTQVFSGQVTKLSQSKGIMLCCSHLGLWRSTDNGEKWNRVFTNVSAPFLVQPVGDEWVTIIQNREIINTWTPNMVFTSSDKGLTWHPVKEAFPVELNTIYDIRESGKYRIACSNNGIYRSADKGKSWIQVFAPLPERVAFIKLYSSGQNLFAMRFEGC